MTYYPKKTQERSVDLNNVPNKNNQEYGTVPS